jgi:dihydrofolate reductase
MPKKTKKKNVPAPIRPELIEPLSEILRDRGHDIREWPADEAAAYRDNGRFREGHDAAQRVKMAKAAVAIEEVFRPVIDKAVIHALSRARYMSDLSDRSHASILEELGVTIPVEPARPVREERVALIWAESRNGVIGANGAIPWHLPEDFKHFRETTAGQPVIMGRGTWESLPEKSRPLPGRTNIVVTSQAGWAARGAVRASNLQEALEAADAVAKPGDRIWIIGGKQLYEEAVHVAETAIITVLDLEVDGDTTAPRLPRPWVAHRREPAEGWSMAADGTRYRIETWHPGL